jgi:hypothetical protein
MEPKIIVGYDTRSCIYCNGDWITFETINTIITELSETKERDSADNLILDEIIHEGSRKCPKCENKNLHVVDVEGMELDICKTCRGIFFDDGELEMLVGKIPEEDSSNNGYKIYLTAKLAILALSMGTINVN